VCALASSRVPSDGSGKVGAVEMMGALGGYLDHARLIGLEGDSGGGVGGDAA